MRLLAGAIMLLIGSWMVKRSFVPSPNPDIYNDGESYERAYKACKRFSQTNWVIGFSFLALGISLILDSLP